MEKFNPYAQQELHQLCRASGYEYVEKGKYEGLVKIITELREENHLLRNRIGTYKNLVKSVLRDVDALKKRCSILIEIGE